MSTYARASKQSTEHLILPTMIHCNAFATYETHEPAECNPLLWQGAFPEDDGDSDDDPVFGDDAFDEMNGW